MKKSTSDIALDIGNKLDRSDFFDLFALTNGIAFKDEDRINKGLQVLSKYKDEFKELLDGVEKEA